MIDLFNHKIDVRQNKVADITKQPSNDFRTMQVKPKAKVEKVKEVVVEKADANEAPLINLKDIEVKVPVKEVKKVAPKKATKKDEVK
jgi:hypothetical protein